MEAYDLQFIQHKMRDAGQAMLYRRIDENHKQPLGFKNQIELDENGQLYFSLQTAFEKKHCDDTFPVELFFYKKGKRFSLSVKGIARKEAYKSPAKRRSLEALKISMENIEYMEWDTPSPFKKLMRGLLNIQSVL